MDRPATVNIVGGVPICIQLPTLELLLCTVAARVDIGFGRVLPSISIASSQRRTDKGDRAMGKVHWR